MAKRIKEELIPQKIKKARKIAVPGVVVDLGCGNAIGTSATELKESFNEQRIITTKGYRIDISKVDGKEGVSNLVIYATHHDDLPIFSLNNIILEEDAIDNAIKFMELLNGYNDIINTIVKENNYSINNVKYDISELLESTNLDCPYTVMEQFSLKDFSKLTLYIDNNIDIFNVIKNDLYSMAYIKIGKLYGRSRFAYFTMLEAINNYSVPEFGISYFNNYNDIKSNLKNIEYNEMNLIHETYLYDRHVMMVMSDLSLFRDVEYYHFNNTMRDIQKHLYRTKDIVPHYKEGYLTLSYGKYKEFYCINRSGLGINEILTSKINFFNKYKLLIYDFLKLSPELAVYINLSSKLRDMIKNEYKYSKEELDNEVNKVSFMNNATKDIVEVGRPRETGKITLVDYGDSAEIYTVLENTHMTDELILQVKFIYMLNKYKPTSKEYLHLMQECPITLSDISDMMDNLQSKGYFLIY